MITAGQYQDDPFVRLAQSMMKPSGTGTRLVAGTVTAPVPLTIFADGLALSGEDLCVNAALLEHTVQATVDGRAASVRLPGELAAGALVLLCTVDGQKYYVLCRVVGA